MKLSAPPPCRVEEFEDHMVHDRGLSWRTIMNSTIDLEQFFRFLESEGIQHVDHINRTTIHGFLETLRQEGMWRRAPVIILGLLCP